MLSASVQHVLHVLREVAELNAAAEVSTTNSPTLLMGCAGPFVAAMVRRWWLGFTVSLQHMRVVSRSCVFATLFTRVCRRTVKDGNGARHGKVVRTPANVQVDGTEVDGTSL